MSFKLTTAFCGAAIGVAVILGTALAADWTPLPPVATPAPAATPVQAAPTAAAPEIDPHTDELLTRTCEVLGGADAFSFHAEVLFDEVLPSAVKVQFAGEINFAVQRPDELAIDFNSDLGGKQLWYQKDTLTVLDRPHNMYAELKVPDAIDEMLDRVAEMHNLRLPLSNLAYSNPCQRLRKQILFGTYVGVNDVNGMACDHLAFSSRNIDFQLWLNRSARPIPRKIVITIEPSRGRPNTSLFFLTGNFQSELRAVSFSLGFPRVRNVSSF